MQKPFPALRHLQLGTRDMLWSLVLPSAFLGGFTPRLRHIDLNGTAFPTLPRLLLSATDLVSLRLEEIPNTGYFSPEALVTGLYATPLLKTLEICFLSSTSLAGQGTARPLAPNRAVLPALSELSFRGDNYYLEDLLARIDAPILEQFNVTLFDQLTLDIPQLSRFICRTDELKSSPYRTSIWLLEHGFTITHYFGTSPVPRATFQLQIPCYEVARQVSLLAHICRQLCPLVSSAEWLDIAADRPFSDHGEETDTAEWLELLCPFSSVRRLELTGTLVPSIASALEQSIGEMCQMLLPALRELHLKDTPVPLPDIEAFVVSQQQLSGHVVTVQYAEGEYRDA
jgi:hypothetical protein